MNNIILAIVLLGGCFAIHFFMMRKGHEHEEHSNDTKNKVDDDNKPKHGCCK
jgi:hypothetical protein